MNLPPLDAIVAEQCRRRFLRFFTEFWETVEAVPLVLNWHIEYLCDELQKVQEAWERGETQLDLFINVPPGTSKSSIVTILFPAWCWTRRPAMRIMSASYAAPLAVKHAMKSRDCLKSVKFQRLFPGLIEFKSDADNKTAYSNTAMGERFATSVGGGAIGNHADLIIVDDPIKREEAASEVKREEANSFVTETLSTRKTDKARTVTVVVMQRLHERDPTGVALAERASSIRHICLPGELLPDVTVSPPELKRHYVDKLLDPRRLTRTDLAKLLVTLGTLGYAGQILQRPTAPEGGLLKKKWFGSITWEQFEEMTKGKPVVWEFDADTAYTANQQNDPSALMASAYIGQTLYIREVAEVWEELPGLLRFIPAFVLRNGNSYRSTLHVEPKASGKSTVQSLRAITEINVIEAPSTTDDKLTRVTNCAPFIEAGRVVIIYGEPGKSQGWQTPFIDQCAAFPRGAHDDQLDDLTQRIARIQKPAGGMAGWA